MEGCGNGSRVPGVPAWPFDADHRGVDTPLLPPRRHLNLSRASTTIEDDST